jgi:hypothetical protein
MRRTSDLRVMKAITSVPVVASNPLIGRAQDLRSSSCVSVCRHRRCCSKESSNDTCLGYSCRLFAERCAGRSSAGLVIRPPWGPRPVDRAVSLPQVTARVASSCRSRTPQRASPRGWLTGRPSRFLVERQIADSGSAVCPPIRPYVRWSALGGLGHTMKPLRDCWDEN